VILLLSFFLINAYKIELFLSFDCLHCSNSFLNLMKFKAKNDEIYIYYFCKNIEDFEKLICILAAKKEDAEKIFYLFIHGKNVKEIFQQFSYLKEKIKKNREQYLNSAQKMQEIFIEKKIEGTPTWIVDNKHFFEGTIENVKEILN